MDRAAGRCMLCLPATAHLPASVQPRSHASCGLMPLGGRAARLPQSCRVLPNDDQPVWTAAEHHRPSEQSEILIAGLCVTSRCERPRLSDRFRPKACTGSTVATHTTDSAAKPALCTTIVSLQTSFSSYGTIAACRCRGTRAKVSTTARCPMQRLLLELASGSWARLLHDDYTVHVH